MERTKKALLFVIALCLVLIVAKLYSSVDLVSPAEARRVTTFNYAILALLCAINLMGACWSFWRIGHPEPPAPTAAAPTVPTTPGPSGPPRATPQRP